MLTVSGKAQDFTRSFANADRYFDTGVVPLDVVNLLDPTFGGVLKGGVSTGASTNVSYDTNVDQAPSGFEEDSLLMSLGGSIAYTTDPEGGAAYRINAYYSPSYVWYFDDSSLGGFNQSGGLDFSWSGARTTISAFISFSQYTGADRFTSGYSEGIAASFGMRGTYQVAPRTRVYASVTAGGTNYSTTGLEGAEDYTFTLGANWAATERFRIGPSVRYSVTTSDNTGERNAPAFLINASYVATERINLSASLGIESVENSRDSGSSEISPTGSLRATYKADPRWSYFADISYANIPSPTATNTLINDLSFAGGVSRALDYGSISASVSYSSSEDESVGPLGVSASNENYITTSLNYGRPIFQRASFYAGVSYSYSDGSPSWDRLLVTTGLGMSF